MRAGTRWSLSVGLAALWLFAGSAAWAVGGTETTAPRKDPTFEAAEKAVKAGDYRAAVPLLERAVTADPGNADAFNYLGYSHRKLGAFENAVAHYQRALAIKPDHRGALEYLGELYLQMGNLGAAEEQLKKLDKACFFGCEEYGDLKKAIQEYKARRSS